MFVGDNPIVEIQGANDSGLVPVWMGNHQVLQVKQDQPKFTINRLSDLKNLLARNHKKYSFTLLGKTQ